ncbi:MAG: hypothetical protein AB7O73_08765 [Bacteroidia bacterium]
MVKFIFITINAILFFFISLFGKMDGISVTGNFPKSIAPGKEAVIELRVKKGTMGGFAKLQLDLPEGITAIEGDSKGANFSFNAGLAKWVWPALPTDDEIVITLKLKPDEGQSGVKTIGGKFSYVENNAKQVVEMTPAEVEIKAEETPVANNTDTPPSTPTPTETPKEGGNETASANTPSSTPEAPKNEESAPTSTTASLNDEPENNVTVTRTIKAGTTPDEHIIELKVAKGNVRGFAKYTDILPAGYEAKAIIVKGASFSVADGKIKFVWVSIPSTDEFTVSYQLNGRSKSLVTINGEFSYLANDQSKKFKMPEATLPNTPSSDEPIASNTPTSEPTPTPDNNNQGGNVTETPTTPTVPSTPTTTPKNDDVANNNTGNQGTETPATPTPTETPSTPTEPSTPTTPTVAKTGNVDYRVQIGAYSSSNVTTGKLSRIYGLSEKIVSDMHNGLNKFMVGSHPEYKEARDHRENVRSSVKNAFVVAYNGGNRITVQEALVITNQKWFK